LTLTTIEAALRDAARRRSWLGIAASSSAPMLAAPAA
jgi:hypothetical protein